MTDWSERGIAAITQAENELPRSWLNGSNRHAGRILLGGWALGALISYGETRLGYSLWRQLFTEGIASSAISLGVSAADDRSTINLFRTSREARQLGIPATYEETNPFVGPVDTPEDYKKSKYRYVIIGMNALSSVIWPLGLPVSVIKTQAALYNRRSRKQVERSMEILQEAEGIYPGQLDMTFESESI